MLLSVFVFGGLLKRGSAQPPVKKSAPDLRRSGPPVDEKGVELPTVIEKSTTSANKPNIVLTVIDDWGFGDVSYHDSQVPTTEIERMANAGVVLERFYTGCTCTPSRAMVMTGRYNIRNGMQDSVLHSTEPRGLPLDEKLLPAKLRDAGYATAGVGKWHLGMYRSAYLPERRGFDHFFGIYTGGGSHTAHFSVSQPFTVPGVDGTKMWQGSNLYEDEVPVILASDKAGLHTTHLYSAKALEYAQTMAAAANKSPWFLFLSYQAIHDPITVGDPKYVEETSCVTATVAEDPDVNADLRPTLCGMITEIDDGLKSLRLGLQASNEWDNTILFLLSDNGGVKAHGSSNYPLRGEKGTYYDGGVRVPALVAGGLLENMLSESKVIDRNLHLVDVHATLLELAGITSSTIQKNDSLDYIEEKPLDGTSFWPLLTSDAKEFSSLDDRAVLINLNSDLFAGSGALIQGRYKLVVNPEPNEAAIYSKVRKALGAHTSTLDVKTMENIIRQAHHDVLGETSVHLFDLRANPSETDLGEACSEAAECRDLYNLPDFAKARSQLEASWARFQAQSVPSSFAWEDDGPLADPALFNGFWTPWRDGDGQPKAHYFGTKALDQQADLQQDLSEVIVGTTSASLAESHLSSFTNDARTTQQTLLASTFIGNDSVMQIPYALVAIASFTVGLVVSRGLPRRWGFSNSYFERLP